MSESRAEAVFANIWQAMENGDSARTVAKLAIEASDAWLTARGWKAVPRKRTGAMIRASIATDGHDPNTWYDIWDAAPTPEDTDR